MGPSFAATEEPGAAALSPESGDSACVIPPVSIPEKHIKTIYEYTRTIAREMGVVGLMNIQYAICEDVVYVLEANPRASRTVPLVSKVCGLSMARIATEIMLGKKLGDQPMAEPCMVAPVTDEEYNANGGSAFAIPGFLDVYRH